MAVDWLKIKTEYINDTATSYRNLAEKHGVSFGALRARAEKEQWVAQRETQQHKISMETAQKAAEKISDNESEIAAIKSRLRLKIFEQLEHRMDEEQVDGNDFRRLVQSFKDMCEIRDEIGGPVDIAKDDALSKSLKEMGRELESD